ncbi:FUN14 domain-containing protein 1 [Merluccius polli]|uniref:FUN14 domain-containing protein 2 n=1 Tax=Merluccius polli TaxID=89951 RepID=A0AA47MH95_MERPO|nr:FUN14 domain-containing protein 1 [Merluccius polli]
MYFTNIYFFTVIYPHHIYVYLLQIANNTGYIQVDWKRVEKDVNKAKKQLKKNTDTAVPELNTFVEKSTDFVKKNIVVTSGFVGGFLLGLAS